MKNITIKMELVVPGYYCDKDKIAEYLNDKLYSDPEFFGDFGPENIESIQDIEEVWVLLYHMIDQGEK